MTLYGLKTWTLTEKMSSCWKPLRYELGDRLKTYLEQTK